MKWIANANPVVHKTKKHQSFIRSGLSVHLIGEARSVLPHSIPNQTKEANAVQGKSKDSTTQQRGMLAINEESSKISKGETIKD